FTAETTASATAKTSAPYPYQFALELESSCQALPSPPNFTQSVAKRCEMWASPPTGNVARRWIDWLDGPLAAYQGPAFSGGEMAIGCPGETSGPENSRSCSLVLPSAPSSVKTNLWRKVRGMASWLSNVSHM